MMIYCVGNESVVNDRVPISLLPFLSKEFPKAQFQIIDPSENFIPEASSVIIDTVMGTSAVQIFSDIDAFVVTKSISVHDYDLGLHLQLLKKLHMLPRIHIIAIPMHSPLDHVKSDVMRLLNELLCEKCEK